MSDLGAALGALARQAGGVEAALVLERTGLEVAFWGRGDAEALAAEVAELWRQVGASEALVEAGAVRGFEVAAEGGAWLAAPLGEEYLLVLRTGVGAVPGRVRFYAQQWAAERRGEFA